MNQIKQNTLFFYLDVVTQIYVYDDMKDVLDEMEIHNKKYIIFL